MSEHSPLEMMIDARVPSGLGGHWYGVFPGLVSDIKDPDGQGRVKVTLPWSPDANSSQYAVWARLATTMAGNNRGTWLIPDVNDEVLLAFEAGDVRRPYVVGALWNGSDSPPDSMDGAGNNYRKVIRSRNGVKITLNDQNGQEELILETPGGQKVTLKDGPGSVEIDDSNGNSIKLESAGITVTASAQVNVKATQVSVSAGMVSVDSAMSKFSGVVKADTVICNSIVSASYTPGAGNIW
jgi:uncharacterized protein involved in type VI secretion and phage assembly